MALTTQHGSATIHQFPARMRSTAVARDGGRAAVTELRGPRLERMEFGSAWYHEAAMEEEEASERQRDGH